jgi:hypothetical protein
MDTPLNEGAACIAAGGPKGDDAFLRGECDKNSADNDKNQQKTLPADSLDPGVLLVLRTLISPFEEDGQRIYRRRRLAKRIRRGGDPTKIEPYEGAKNHEACGLDVSTFDKLFDGLVWLSREWAIAVVQGGKIDSADPRRMQRLIYDDYDKETKTISPKTIIDKPSHILPMDIDDLQPPPGVRGLLAIGLWARGLLPPEFRNARCIVVATGSYGFKRGAHIRLWFVLDRALTCGEKRRWLKPLAKIDFTKFVDLGLYSANQLVYTAAPVFDDPDDDPLFDMPRLIVIDGEEFVRTPCAERLKPIVHAHAYHAPISHAAASGDDNGLIRSAMAVILAAEPGERHGKIMRQAFNLAGAAVIGGVDPDRALRALIRAGTRVIPGERVITPDEVIREWNHALLVKRADWELEQPCDPASYDGEDLS